MNRRFFCFHKYRRPYIILKWAQTKEGYIAPANRNRLQITGPESQHLLHKWRTEEAAVMVGYNTALHDDPQLTARMYKGKQPLRIALDRNLQLSASHHLFDNEAATWIINEKDDLLEGNVHKVQLSFDDTLLPMLMKRLHEAKILSLIVEGGAMLLNSFIQQGLWDEARVFTGTTSITNGISAPVLVNETSAFSQASGNDHLVVSVNKNSAFPYITGMEL